MSNKTAMQKLIDYMRANFHLTESVEFEFTDSLLAEKSQIEQSFDAGIENYNDCKIFDGEQYFSQTFENSVVS